MSKLALCSVVALLPVSWIASARGAIISVYDENFNSYPDQAALTAVWPQDGNASDTLDLTRFFSGPNSVTTGTGPTRNSHTIPGQVASASSPTDFSFEFFDTTIADAGSPKRQYAELVDSTGASSSGGLFAMGLNNNIASNFYMARIFGADGGNGTGLSTFFKLDGTGTATPNALLQRSAGWHRLEVLIGNGTADFWVDGLPAHGTVTGFAAGRTLDKVRLGSNLSATADASFDDVHVGTGGPIPEPTSLSLLGAAAVFVLNRRRRV